VLAEEGAVVFAKACELGLEGILSKREGSLYKSGRSRMVWRQNAEALGRGD
jgi:ATP-dependent DNA ligase